MVFNHMVITLWNHHHDQSVWTQSGGISMQVYCVWEQNNNKLRGLRAQSIVHTIDQIGGANSRSRIICWEIDLYWE